MLKKFLTKLHLIRTPEPEVDIWAEQKARGVIIIDPPKN